MDVGEVAGPWKEENRRHRRVRLGTKSNWAKLGGSESRVPSLRLRSLLRYSSLYSSVSRYEQPR